MANIRDQQRPNQWTVIPEGRVAVVRDSKSTRTGSPQFVWASSFHYLPVQACPWRWSVQVTPALHGQDGVHPSGNSRR